MEVKDWIIILQWPVVGAIITLLLGPLVRNWVGHGFEKRMESVRSLMAIQYGTTKRMLDLHDEALIIIGETKSIKLALEAGQKRGSMLCLR